MSDRLSVRQTQLLVRPSAEVHSFTQLISVQFSLICYYSASDRYFRSISVFQLNVEAVWSLIVVSDLGAERCVACCSGWSSVWLR